jgi:hypothetical protein
MAAPVSAKPTHINTPQGARFAPGHPKFPPRGPRQPSITQQRKAQTAALSRMIADMAAAHDRGEPIDPNAYVRLVHLQMRLQAEL